MSTITILKLQAQLSPSALIAEFFFVLIATSCSMGYKCLSRSGLFWKRTDYLYFFMTIAGAALALADYSNSSWNRQLQDLRFAQADVLGRLRDDATSILKLCDNWMTIKRQQSQENERFSNGVIAPNSQTQPLYTPNEWYMEARLGIPKMELPTKEIKNDCEIASNISVATGPLESDHLHALEVILPLAESDDTYYDIVISSNSHPLADLGEIEDPNQGSETPSMQGLPTPGISLRYYRKSPTSTVHRADLIRKLMTDGDALAQLQANLASIYYAGLIRKFFPLPLAFGLGVRLARTHYDIKREKRDTRV